MRSTEEGIAKTINVLDLLGPSDGQAGCILGNISFT